ncbi:MAG: hypothetical protein WCO84_06405 [bacterium]
MTRDDFDDWAKGFSPDESGTPVIFPDLEDAIIGIVERFGMEPIVLYDRDKTIQILMFGGMSEEEAEEWFSFNTMGTWAGPGTPAFATLIKED